MIVLKSPQDKVLAVLQSVADIVERRQTLLILANRLIRRTNDVFIKELTVIAKKLSNLFKTAPLMRRVRCWSGDVSLCLEGFFSAGKTNLRNAP